MKTEGITKNSCDRPGCNNQENVLPDEKPKAKWEPVVFRNKTFDFCGRCCLQIFGEEFVSKMEVAADARHLRSDEQILADKEEQKKRVQKSAPRKFIPIQKLNKEAIT